MASISENYGAGAKYAKRMCAGYKSGGGVKPVVRKGVKQHEDALHDGKHSKLKLKAGGHVKGKAAAERPDRRARGGKIGSVVINIKAPGQGDGQADDMKQQMAAKAGLQKGVAIGAQMAAAKGPMPGAGGPPPPGPMPGGPPGGPPPGPAPMMPRARGGKIHMTGSAAGGLGRLEKSGMVNVKAHSRRRGGACS